MADLDPETWRDTHPDEHARLQKRNTTTPAVAVGITVAEVDRLQAIEDAAREAIHPDDCDDDRGYSPTCRRDVPDYPEEWCPTCRLAAALEADRG